jgi:putative RecB family exonuclease
MSYEVPGYFSPSSLSTWQQCPKRFYYEKIEGRRGPGTDASIRGNFVHSVLEDLLKLDPEERTLDAARSITRLLWDGEYEGEVEHLFMSAEELKRFRWMSWWCVEQYFKMENPSEFIPMGLEVEVEGRIDGVPIFGIVDRWSMTDTGKIIVGDYKTGKVPKARYSGEKKLQIMIYADLLEQQTGLEAYRMDLLYVKDAKLVSYLPTDELRESTALTLTTAWDEMNLACESEKFPTQTGPLCNWCDFKPECPAFAKRS